MHFRQIEEQFIQHQMNLGQRPEGMEQMHLNRGLCDPESIAQLHASAFEEGAAENATSFQPGPTFPSD